MAKSTRSKSDGGTVKGPTGRTFTKTITQGPNKGDKVSFKVSPSGKPFPTRVIRDVGNPSTLRDNPGVKIGKGKSKTKK